MIFPNYLANLPAYFLAEAQEEEVSSLLDVDETALSMAEVVEEVSTSSRGAGRYDVFIPNKGDGNGSAAADRARGREGLEAAIVGPSGTVNSEAVEGFRLGDGCGRGVSALLFDRVEDALGREELVIA
ncbi:hypothetical protein M7I_3399 [Glarea lozoyensis 74030]|uniref:Uncharacterized protein n=1 Tax=Glarea lozoyensis (strain ATCC 74030 / MF5533) TaxID=1104152 RepID=H0ELD6_GLAL7|nr:hypothetical protein M7I_3399 [Glarea lozoyensis 74030]